MAFNSDSYYRNKARRDAITALTEARQLKAEPDLELERIMGAGYNAERVSWHVRMARSSWRLYLTFRFVAGLSSRAAAYKPAAWRTRK